MPPTRMARAVSEAPRDTRSWVGGEGERESEAQEEPSLERLKEEESMVEKRRPQGMWLILQCV